MEEFIGSAPGQMLTGERRERLLEILERDGVVRISALADGFGVTTMTVRRDLEHLERDGLLSRVRGGAVKPRRPAQVAPSAPVTGTIGIVVPSLSFYWPTVVRGVETHARQAGLKVLLRGSSYDSPDERPLLDALVRTEGVAGLLLTTGSDLRKETRLHAWLEDCPLPAVLMEREAPRRPNGQVWEAAVSDHALGGLMAAQHLTELGHRKVGLVLTRDSPTTRKIAVGWQQACKEYDLARDQRFERLTPNRHSPSFAGTAEQVIDTVLATGTTALIVHSDPEAFAVLQHAQERGLSVPGDLSIIGYDDETASLYSPALTAVSPRREAVGAAAFDLLVQRMEDPDRPVHRVVVSPELVVRETTGPVGG